MNFTWLPYERFTRFVQNYLTTPLGVYYTYPTYRLFLYFLLTALFLTGGLVGMVLYKGPSVLVHKMAFTTVYCLHVALAYACCHWIVDLGVSRVWRAWGGYVHRTVGRLWMVWFMGFLTGFIFHRTLLPFLIPLYAPEVHEHYASAPHARPSHAAFFFVGLPLWFGAVFLTIRIALRNHPMGRFRPQQETTEHAEKPETVVDPENETIPQAQETSPEFSPVESLVVTADAKPLDIPYSSISHITVEDHYSRIFLKNGETRNNVLIRSPLKELLKKLPQDRFLQIHRSHVVNLEHVSRLRKTGREAKVMLRSYGLELPVSRYRLAHIRSTLPDMGNI